MSASPRPSRYHWLFLIFFVVHATGKRVWHAPSFFQTTTPCSPFVIKHKISTKLKLAVNGILVEVILLTWECTLKRHQFLHTNLKFNPKVWPLKVGIIAKCEWSNFEWFQWQCIIYLWQCIQENTRKIIFWGRSSFKPGYGSSIQWVRLIDFDIQYLRKYKS